MSEALRAAAIAAGMIDTDCLRLVPFSRDAPAEQVARLQKEKPHWFHNAAAPNYRTMSKEDFKREMAKKGMRVEI